MKGTLLWRYRVGFTSGVLMILSLHLISSGVKPGDIALRPAGMTLSLLAPVEAAINNFAQGSTGFVRNYFDLVNVRRENERLKAELALVKTDQSRMVRSRPKIAISAICSTSKTCWAATRSLPTSSVAMRTASRAP